MAQIIKHKRGSLEKLSSVTGSLQKGELVIATGSAKLGNVTNGQALVFAAFESGAIKATNRVLRGDVAPIFSASIYNGMLDGVPFYASSSNTLFLLGSDNNEAIDLSGNISAFSSSVSESIANLSSSIQSVTGDFSSSVATSFSASAFTVSTLSASVASDLNTLSGSLTESIGLTQTSVTNLSSSVATDFSASNASIAELSASVASVTGDFSSSVATSFSASAFTVSTLSASVATDLSSVSGAFATSTSASNASIASLSASVASVTGDFSSSVATSFSASAASQLDLSASIAVTDNAQSDRLDVIESTYATTGSNIFVGTQTITGSLYITQDLVVYGSSSLQNITASAASLGTNTIILNTADPAFRFGGISVIDSGSQQNTGSLLWDSEREHWLYQRSETGSYGSAILIAGPKNTGALGEEVELTPGYIQVAVGGDHIDNSIMSQSAGLITTFGDFKATGSISSSTIAGIGNVTLYSQSVDSRVSTIEASIGGGGSLGTRVANLETISASYLEFTQSYYSDSSSFQSGIDDVVGDLNTISGSVFTQFSASAASQTTLSASVATSISNVSGAFATSISASDAEYTSFSASAASDLNSVSGAFATSTSASKFEYTAFSASAASDLNSVSGAFATSISASDARELELSTSVDSRLDTIETSLGGGGSLGSRVAGLEALTGSYATTGSNVFKGEQIISSSLLVTNEIKGTGSIFLQPDASDSRKLEIYNTAATDVHIKATGGLTFLGDDTNYVKIDDSLETITIESTNGVTIDTSVTISAELSASTINGIGNVTLFSSSVDSRFSASVASVTLLSSSVSSISGAVATSLSESKFEYTSFSASLATELGFIEDDVAFAFSASTANINNVSASLSSISGAFDTTIDTLSSSVATQFSASSYEIAQLSASVASTTGDFSSSVDGRLKAEEFKSTTFATTGSNSFTGSQGILGDVTVSGSLSIQFGQDLITNHISGNQGTIELGNTDNNINITAQHEIRLTATGSGVHVHTTNFSVSPSGLNNNVLIVSASQTTITNELSASNISGVGNIGAFSQSVNSRLLSAETFKSNIETAISVSGSNVTILGDLKVNGTTTQIDSTVVNIGDNIISLNGTGGAFGGLVVKDPTSPNTASGSLLWDTTNDYWIAGAEGNESKVLVAVGDNVVSSSTQITISSTTGFSGFDSAISTSFSASNASIASLSASVSSVTGEFSSSVATSFSASAFTVSTLSASVASDLSSVSGAFATSTSASNAAITSLSASVASVTGDFSSSVATSFSASAFTVSTLSASVASDLSSLSASIYLTDATQSTDITNNSSSFATSISASNFRITVLETTIDGGSY